MAEGAGGRQDELSVPLPVAHALIGATLAVASLSVNHSRRWPTILAAAILAISPDFDFFMVWVLDLGNEWHRGFSHSLVVATSAAVLLWIALPHRRDEILACSLAVASHGVLDALATEGGGGVALFWPLTQERFHFGLLSWLAADYVEGPISAGGAVYWLLHRSLIEALACLPLFALVVAWKRQRRLPDGI